MKSFLDAGSRFIQSEKVNILLTGPPGAGKSVVALELASKLKFALLDIDNDYLEKKFQCTVAEKLSALGDELFLDAEAEAVCELNGIENTVISLTGSIPLRVETMRHLRVDGFAVFLDVPHSDIIKRCEEMKVDRIVGQASSTLAEILENRRKIYESTYDARVLVPLGASVSEITQLVIDVLSADQRFCSTRQDSNVPSSINQFEDVIVQGLAHDGGLYVPIVNPTWSLGQIERLVALNYEERALRVLERFPCGQLNPHELSQMLHKAYTTFADPTNPLPLRHLEKNQFILEEFHGPTASFKDLALQLTPSLFQHAVKYQTGNSDYLFLVATSGDTGAACLEGFGRNKNTPVFVLFPDGGVSAVQETQMTNATGDVCVLNVNSDFDFCQSFVKDMFRSKEVRDMFSSEFNVQLASGNSMNWGRLFPQIPYTFHAYCELVKSGKISLGESIDVVVPTGNFGNILGGIMARHMGLPVRTLVVACNDNNVLHEFCTSGNFDLREKKLVKTPSPSIDILKPSNLERFLYMLTTGDAKQVRTWFTQLAETQHFSIGNELLEAMTGYLRSGMCTTQECISQIKEVYERTQQILDPHTAVAVHVANEYQKRDDHVPIVVVSTAHFAKFPETILSALNVMREEESDVMKLFNGLKHIISETKFHSNLDRVMASRRAKDEVILPTEPEQKIIREKIYSFLTKRHANKQRDHQG